MYRVVGNHYPRINMQIHRSEENQLQPGNQGNAIGNSRNEIQNEVGDHNGRIV